MGNVEIVEARPEHLPSVLDIINHMVRHTDAIWTEQPWSQDDLLSWFDYKKSNNHPVFVAIEGNRVLGYATYTQFRDKTGYKQTMEHSVYVAPNAQGRGVGKKLMNELEKAARLNNVHVLVGGIDSANTPSIALHQSLGFEVVGRMNEVGQKNGRWLDLVFVQKTLLPGQ